MIIQENDHYFGLCCQGFDYEVAYIAPDDSIWGRCMNPDHAEDPDYPWWDGVSNYYRDDFEERLQEMAVKQ